jgi:hypothetical protein
VQEQLLGTLRFPVNANGFAAYHNLNVLKLLVIPQIGLSIEATGLSVLLWFLRQDGFQLFLRVKDIKGFVVFFNDRNLL